MSHNPEIKIALAQMTSVDDQTKNFQQIEKLLVSVQPGDIDLICFPENSLYMRIKEGEAVPGFSLKDQIFLDLATLAKNKKAHFHLGSIAIKEPQGIYNASVLISPAGEVKVSYRKMHLFDIELTGQKPIRESDVYKSGEKPETFKIGDWVFGQTICYDIRFSELFSQYAMQQVDVILIPSSFLVPTGKVHWDILNRARAIESQAYILSAAQCGSHVSRRGAARQTYGHSLIVDPWGEILSEGSADQAQLLCSTLSKAAIQKVRTQIPMYNHRRRDILFELASRNTNRLKPS